MKQYLIIAGIALVVCVLYAKFGSKLPFIGHAEENAEENAEE